MANFWNGFLNQLGRGDQIKDYQHAAKTFVDGLYRLSPKIGSMYHVFIELNPTIALEDQNKQIEIGLMAKSVSLPKYTIQQKTYNAYNRKNIAQERINYEPVNLVFHDDSADVVRQFWYQYYQYYYRDSDHQLAMYNQDHKYKSRQEQRWGFSPNASGKFENYINAIRIYSLHQKQFTSYILIRPTILSFQHGQHTAGEYTPLEHTMSVGYEAVQYETGSVTNGTVQGFNVIHYDNSPSPLSALGGGTTSILGPGGLISGVDSVTTNLQNGNFLGAALGAARTANNFRNSNFSDTASAELTQLSRNILRGQNPLSTIYVPTAASVTSGLSKATQAIPGLGRVTNAAGINSQNNLVPSSNQGKS